jgi:DNA polymerase-3 subunit alpha
VKLTKKTSIHYKGKVVDLTVQNSHTYNVERISVHNSGAGSLINYILDITDLDPIEWDLPFGRFLSIYRVGLPDVDTDVSDRDKILDVMREQFGNTNVVPISNYNTTKLKSLTKDISKFYGLPFDEVNIATATVEQDVRKAVTKHGDDKNLFVLTYDEAMLYSKSYREFIEKYPQVGESIKVLFKQNRSLGRHAGGVLLDQVLQPQPRSEY